MRPKPIAPTITEDTGSMAGTVKTHPAYGMVSFSRISGSPGKLFGSEINHQSFIRLTIRAAEVKWHSSQDWYGPVGLKPLCEVDLSAAQFAELLTSMGVGFGVPCTLTYVNGLSKIPGIKDDTTLHQQIKDDLKQDAKDAFASAKALIHKLTETLAASKLSKANQAELISLANSVVNKVEDSMPFVIDQYEEAAEKVGAKAKAELDAFATMVVNQLGRKALETLNQGETVQPPVALD